VLENTHLGEMALGSSYCARSGRIQVLIQQLIKRSAPSPFGTLWSVICYKLYGGSLFRYGTLLEWTQVLRAYLHLSLYSLIPCRSTLLIGGYLYQQQVLLPTVDTPFSHLATPAASRCTVLEEL
jgi:hypothetical protein